MRYALKKFKLYLTKKNHYVYAATISAKISYKLYQLLDEIQQREWYLIELEQLQTLAGKLQLDTDQVIHFLADKLGLMASVPSDSFGALYLCSDNTRILELLSSEFAVGYNLDVITTSRLPSTIKPNSLCLLFREDYDAQAFEYFYRASAPDNTYYVTAYLAHKYLVINNIYNKLTGVPCHFCSVSRITAPTKTSPDLQDFSWLSFYRSLLHDNAKVLPAIPLSPLLASYVAYALAQFIRRFLDLHEADLLMEELNQFWHVDLERMSTEKEVALHWPLCGCVNS